MTEFDKNKLIGIPFKLNRKDFDGCDCRGIVCLYYKYVKNIELPFTDGKRIFFRNRKHDVARIIAVISKIMNPVSFSELNEGDLVILKNICDKGNGGLGVCINKHQVLHMDQVVGSCLTKLEYIKPVFLFGFRLI